MRRSQARPPRSGLVSTLATVGIGSDSHIRQNVAGVPHSPEAEQISEVRIGCIEVRDRATVAMYQQGVDRLVAQR